MKKYILILSAIMLLGATAFASENCFIAKENGKVLKSEGDCNSAYTPESTFKIALSLIGFDSGILKDEINPT